MRARYYNDGMTKFRKRYSPKKFYLILALVFIVVAFVFIWYMTRYPWYFSWLTSLSVVTFFLYGYDKWSAINKWGRVPKIVLHILALLGGVVGGWLGMLIFKHKKNKLSFYLILLLATIIHGVLLYLFFFPEYAISFW